MYMYLYIYPCTHARTHACMRNVHVESLAKFISEISC